MRIGVVPVGPSCRGDALCPANFTQRPAACLRPYGGLSGAGFFIQKVANMMKRSHSTLPFLFSLLSAYGQIKGPQKPVGGHRAHGYQKTSHDLQRIAAAQDRRERRAEKRYEDHRWALANDPCRRTKK